MSSTTSDFTKILPKDHSLQVFSYLGITSLLRSSYVNKKWNQLTSDDFLWKKVVEKYLNNMTIPPNCQNIKKYLSKFPFVWSQSIILSRLKEFMQKIELNQKGIFSLYEEKTDFLRIEFAYTERNYEGSTIKQECIYRCRDWLRYYIRDRLRYNREDLYVGVKYEKESPRSLLLSSFSCKKLIRLPSYPFRLHLDISFPSKVRKILNHRCLELDSQVKNKEWKYLSLIAATSICAAAIFYSYYIA